jgi:hypothetical protein
MSSVVVSTKKPFCKVCLDVGKQESEYTNHWTKNDKGKVICPTLLEMFCKYCFKKAHTVSYCPVLAKNKKREAFKESSLTKKNVQPSKTITNLFQALEEDSEDSEEEEEEDIVEFDPPCSPVSPPPSFFKPTYASILCKEKKVVNLEKEEVVQPTLRPVLPLKRKKMWAECTSDDDMDEDD